MNKAFVENNFCESNMVGYYLGQLKEQPGQLFHHSLPQRAVSSG